MIYLTHTRLMVESENTVQARAAGGEAVPRRVCTQLLSDAGRYSLWHIRHETSMNEVAARKRRELQILQLRAVAVEQTHRTALIRYLRDYRVTSERRDQTLREFYGVTDLRHAAIAEHRTYLLAASTQFCALDLLDLVGDAKGLELLRSYEMAYGQYFSMFCERARALQKQSSYLLATLIPEVRDSADRLRRRILAGQLLPPQPTPVRAKAH